MALLRPCMPLERLSNSPQSPIHGLDLDLIASSLPLRSGRRSARKVFDVRWRLLTDSAVVRHPPSVCPHCGLPDSSRHRFLDCRIALEERQTAFRLWPDLPSRIPILALLFPPEDKLAIADALLWRIHLRALHKAAIIDRTPAPLQILAREFMDRP